MRTEKQFIDWLRARYGRRRARGLVVGLGDDAAVIRPRAGRELVVTTDLFIENVHFRRAWMTARQAGRRALARGLSDIAAMGAVPRLAFFSVAVARGLPTGWLEEFFSGAMALARRFGVTLGGGDLGGTAREIHADVVILGDVERGRTLSRSGARAGDVVFVTGRLGLARAGLEALRRRLERHREFAAAVRAHVKPEPRLTIGRYLAQQRLASAAIDLSDGLSTDLHHLCQESGVGARIHAARIPQATQAGSIKKLLRSDLLALALHGGEDYELLFTVPRAKVARVPRRIRGVALTRIGEITRARRVVLEDAGREGVLRPGGWEHFR